MNRLFLVFLSIILSMHHTHVLIASSVSEEENIYKIMTMKKANDLMEVDIINTKNKSSLHDEINLQDKTSMHHAGNTLYQYLLSCMLAYPNSAIAKAYQPYLDQENEDECAILNEMDIDSYQPDQLTLNDIEIIDEIVSSNNSPSYQSDGTLSNDSDLHDALASLLSPPQSPSLSSSSIQQNRSSVNRSLPDRGINKDSLRKNPTSTSQYSDKNEEIRKRKLKQKIKQESSH